MTDSMRTGPLRWEQGEDGDDDFWLVYRGDALVGEAYLRGSTPFWHDKLSDWRSSEDTMDEAKAALTRSLENTP